MVPSGTWVLAVDFGNTNTVAAVGDNNGVRCLTIDGRTIMPSAVLLMQDKLGQGDRWLVGDRAINMAPQRLERFERTPKHRIGEESLLMGDRFVPVVEAVAAVLRVLVDEAVRQRGPRPPARFVVPHPANWPWPRIRVLMEAARKAADHQWAWPEPEPLPEPLAAAHRVLETAALPRQARIVVLDYGQGTVKGGCPELTRK